MASRKISDLRPEFQPIAEAFKAECAKQGIDVLIYCTLRDDAEQAMLYAQGRTKPGDIVTDAKPGDSWHNYGLAFDFVPMVGGKPAWKDKALYARCGAIGEALGMEWAGRWTGRLRETAHMQYRPGGVTLAALKAARGARK